MSDEPTDDPYPSVLDHGEPEGNISKQWVNKSKHGTTPPSDDIDVKSDWVGITIYLPEEVREDLDLVFQEHSLEAKRSTDLDLKKLRHYYPLVVALGLRIVEDIDTQELAPLLMYLTSEYEQRSQ